MASKRKHWPKLADLAEQTDPLVIRRTLLEALDCTIEICEERCRVTKNGESYDDPDSAGINKAIELAAKITGAVGVDPAVLLSFRAEAERLVERAKAVLVARETTGVETSVKRLT